MKSLTWMHGVGLLLICVGAGACQPQTSGRQEAQTPDTAPAVIPSPGQPAPTTGADPYATMPPADQTGPMTGNDTIGDTLQNRCAGLSGQALTDCVDAERLRRQDLQDPIQPQPIDVPRQ